MTQLAYATLCYDISKTARTFFVSFTSLKRQKRTKKSKKNKKSKRPAVFLMPSLHSF
jgi:hypothetical protein